MSYKFRSEKEDPRSPALKDATREPAHVVWARQFQAPKDIPKPPPAHETWAKQFPSKLPKGAHKEPANETWARQFAPKPAAVPTSTAIARTFTASRKPESTASLGVYLRGIRGCDAPSGVVERIRGFITKGTIDALIEARELVETLPEDHPQGHRLVRELFGALAKINSRPTSA